MNAHVQPTLQIAQLLCRLQRVEGRKKMQKIVHILQELGQPFPERFEYSYYGMYSRQLRTELDALERENFVVEEPIGNALGERTYSFKSTPALKDFLKEVEADTEPVWAGIADRLNSLHAQ